MAARACLIAVNRTIRASGLKETGPHAALIDFARNLARRIDKAGPDEVPINVLRLYDSAITKLERAAATKAAAKVERTPAETAPSESAEPVSPPALTIVEESPLDRIRKKKHAAG